MRIVMARTNKVGTHKTTVTQVDGVLTVRYHSTDVVVATPTTVKLNTGGWFSNTTKSRMNQAAAQFGLGYSVYQKRGSWFVDTNGKTVKFDGDTIEFAR
jgi:hypothetical protein